MIIELVDCKTPACIDRGDTKHRIEWDGPTLQEARRIQKTTGLTIKDWDAALSASEFDMHSLEALLMWGVLVHARLGIVVAFDEVDFAVQDFQVLTDPDPDLEATVGKETPTSPHPDGDHSSTSGDSSEAASTPRSSTTPPTSGGGSDSP